MLRRLFPQIPINLFFLLIFALIGSFQTYHIDGNVIYDLESTTSSDFDSELASWTSTATYSSNKVTSCWGNYIAGGYGVLTSGSGTFSRTYSTPQPHNTLQLSIQIYQVDSWDPSDSFSLSMDGYAVPGWSLMPSMYGGTDVCGAAYVELPPLMLYATIPHSSGTFQLIVQSSFDENSYDESLGFRDVTITLLSTSPAPTAAAYCGRTVGYPLPYNWCSCNPDQYMASAQSGYCIDCDSNCATCSGSATTCTSCKAGWFMVGTTCYSTCNSPLTTSVTNGVTYCGTPCSGQYVYWDGSCGSTCVYSNAYGTFSVTPSVESTYSRCDYPCLGTGQYLYWNTSCLSTCPEPLTATPYKSRNFCNYPCASTSQYLYWDKSCQNTCPFPLLSEVQGNPMQRKFCWYPCQPSQFLLSDGSCVDNCPSGYFENTALHDCQPCQDSLCAVCAAPLGDECQLCKGSNVLDSNGVCKDCQAFKNELLKQNDQTYTYQYKLRLLPASCDLDEITVQQYLSPTQDSKNQFPSFSFQVNQAQDSTGTKFFVLEIQFQSAISSDSILSFSIDSLKTDLQVPRTPGPSQSTADQGVKATFAAVTGSTVGAGLTLGATAALWSIISFQQFVGYFVYLNIQLPPHLIYFLTMFDHVSLEILPNPLKSLTEQFAELWDSLVNNTDKRYQLPHKFTEFDTPTLFVINAGSTFFVCIILLLMPYLFDLLRKFKPLGRIKFIQNLHSSLRWNIPIRIFLESGIPLTFALLIQVRKVSYSNVPYGISTVTTILAFIYVGMMINYISQTLRDFKYEDLKEPNVEKSIGTLFEGIVLKKEKPSGKYYYLLILFRGMLLVFVDVFVDQFPIVQTTSMAVFNGFFAYFVWKVIKFKSRYLNWTNRIKEVLILITELFFMTLCYLQNEKYRDIVGWLIISMLGLNLAMELLFGFYLQVLAVRDFVKTIREICKKKKKVLVIAPIATEETFRNVLTIETERKADLTFIS